MPMLTFPVSQGNSEIDWTGTFCRSGLKWFVTHLVISWSIQRSFFMGVLKRATLHAQRTFSRTTDKKGTLHP